jgi:hypothetical protein
MYKLENILIFDNNNNNIIHTIFGTIFALTAKACLAAALIVLAEIIVL